MEELDKVLEIINKDIAEENEFIEDGKKELIKEVAKDDSSIRDVENIFFAIKNSFWYRKALKVKPETILAYDKRWRAENDTTRNR